jgi:hypothetical protein
MKHKRKYKTPFRHIVILEILYSILAGVIIYSFNGNDFIKITTIEIIIGAIVVGTIATYIHVR